MLWQVRFIHHIYIFQKKKTVFFGSPTEKGLMSSQHELAKNSYPLAVYTYTCQVNTYYAGHILNSKYNAVVLCLGGRIVPLWQILKLIHQDAAPDMASSASYYKCCHSRVSLSCYRTLPDHKHRNKTMQRIKQQQGVHTFCWTWDVLCQWPFVPAWQTAASAADSAPDTSVSVAESAPSTAILSFWQTVTPPSHTDILRL